MAGVWLAVSLAAAAAVQALSGGAAVTFADGTRVAVEVVATPESRQRGLMFREHLPQDRGMVFVFPEPGYYPFWMKNTLIPLDMIWLDARRTVVAIAASVPPCKADPCPTYAPVVDGKAVGNAVYVVEVASGFARRHGVKVGDRLRMDGVPERGK
ncbi:MAG: DUF192 domain-containing protein [Acidobacteriota bacterium]